MLRLRLPWNTHSQSTNQKTTHQSQGRCKAQRILPGNGVGRALLGLDARRGDTAQLPCMRVVCVAQIYQLCQNLALHRIELLAAEAAQHLGRVYSCCCCCCHCIFLKSYERVRESVCVWQGTPRVQLEKKKKNQTFFSFLSVFRPHPSRTRNASAQLHCQLHFCIALTVYDGLQAVASGKSA